MDKSCYGTPRRKKRTAQQERTPFDGLRLWSALTHGAGALLAALGTILLLLRAAEAGGIRHAMSFAVYGLSMTGLYTASTLYHSVRAQEKGRIALRKYDHCSIYFLIAGTYTPICLVALGGRWGWSLFGVIWGLAAAGLVLSVMWIAAPRWLTTGIYLAMGWLAVTAICPLSRVMPAKGLFWLLGGGVLYTVGGVCYALKWPGADNKHFGFHETFHIFTLLGSFFHFMLMYRVIVYIA